MLAQPRRFVPALALVLAACADGGVTVAAPPATPVDTTPGGTTPPVVSYQFGAKFEPPAGRVVHGLGQWQDYNVKYSALLPPALQPASELMFITIADSLRPWNPAQLLASMNDIDARGRIPLLDIAPRGNQPNKAEYAALADKLFAVDHEVANSTKWDARLQDLANVIANFRKPVLVRIGGEMNGWWNGYHPWEFPKAFRKIVGMIRAAGAANAAFVWCYEPAAPDDFDAQDANGNWKWYPGDDAVDWFSVDLYSKSDVNLPATGHNGSLTSYGRTIRFLDMAVAAKKPVVIAESSPQQYDFAVASQATAAWGEWFAPYFALITNRPEVKWFTFVTYDWPKASYYAESGWKNNDLAVSAALVAQYAAEIAKPKYLHGTEKVLLKDYALYK